MMPYFNKITRTVAIPGFHSIDPPDVVWLEKDNPMFDQSIRDDQQVRFSETGIPVGFEDKPIVVKTEEVILREKIIERLDEKKINSRVFGVALYSHWRGNQDKLTHLNNKIQQIMSETGATEAEVLDLL